MKSLPKFILSFFLFLTGAQRIAARYPNSEEPSNAAIIYDANPRHIWNRLYDVLFLRKDQAGNTYGTDALDPLLWPETQHLLAGSSHREALSILNEFLRTHAENQVRSPLKRACCNAMSGRFSIGV